MVIVWVGKITEPYIPRKPSRAFGPDPVDKTRSVEGVATHETGRADKSEISINAVLPKPYEEPPRTQFKPALTVAQIMTRSPVTIPLSGTVARARDLLIEHRIRHLPVMDMDNRLAGIVSDRDLLKAHRYPDNGADRFIEELMTRRVLAAAPQSLIRDVAGAMAREKIHCFPVVNDTKELTGIITSSDILRCLVNREPLDLWI